MTQRNTRRGFMQQETNQNKSHSRMSLSGIFNDCRCKTEEKTLLNKYVEDPRLQLSGMTPNRITAHGFTLIELLVVVLIIGILAAVALPQYNKAVIKSRVAEYETTMKAIADAAQVCRLQKEETCTLDELDIEVPACVPDKVLFGDFDFCEYLIINNNVELYAASTYLLTYYPSPTDIIIGVDVDEITHRPTSIYGQVSSGLYCKNKPDLCRKLGFKNSLGTNLYAR